MALCWHLTSKFLRRLPVGDKDCIPNISAVIGTDISGLHGKLNFDPKQLSQVVLQKCALLCYTEIAQFNLLSMKVSVTSLLVDAPNSRVKAHRYG